MTVVLAKARRIRGRLRGEDGSVATETVIAVPLAMFLILIVIHAALWIHANHVAESVATRALSAARVAGGSAETGEETGRQAAAQLGAGVLLDPTIRVERGAERAQVEVTGVAPRVVPLLDLPVHAAADGPVERFVPDE